MTGRNTIFHKKILFPYPYTFLTLYSTTFPSRHRALMFLMFKVYYISLVYVLSSSFFCVSILSELWATLWGRHQDWGRGSTETAATILAQDSGKERTLTASLIHTKFLAWRKSMLGEGRQKVQLQKAISLQKCKIPWKESACKTYYSRITRKC